MAAAKNRWYLRGWEREADRRNTYRLDKIDETSDVPVPAPAGDPASFEIPGDFDPAVELSMDPNAWGHDPVIVAQIHVEPSHLAAFLHEFDATVVQSTGGDVEVEVRHRNAFIRRLLAFRDHVRLLGPPISSPMSAPGSSRRRRPADATDDPGGPLQDPDGGHCAGRRARGGSRWRTAAAEVGSDPEELRGGSSRCSTSSSRWAATTSSTRAETSTSTRRPTSCASRTRVGTGCATCGPLRRTTTAHSVSFSPG